MAKKPTVTTITSGYASNTQLNANFTALRNAFDNTLSLDGSTPNAMGADLDLNNNDILNVNALEVVALRVDGEDLDLSGVATLAPISADIVTLAQLQDGTVALYGLSDLAAISADITSLAPAAGSIPTVAAIDTEVVSVAGIAADVTTVAANVTSVANFADKYVVSATEPASPTEGMLWYDTSADIMKVYDGSSFVAAGSAVNGTAERYLYTATSGQTTFAVTYDVGFVDVYLNGVKLAAGTDYTATNGSSVVLASGAALNDVVDIVAYGAFSVANTYTVSQTDNLLAVKQDEFTTSVITGNTSAQNNYHYYLNGSAITLTLPATPSVGDEVRVSEAAGNSNCVVARNGSNIMSLAENLTLDTAYAVVSLKYVNSTIGWALS